MQKNNAEMIVSSDSKTIQLGEHEAKLKRRFLHKLWLSPRWEVKLIFDAAAKKSTTIHVSADKIEDVKTILSTHAKLVGMRTANTASAIQNGAAQIIKDYKFTR